MRRSDSNQKVQRSPQLLGKALELDKYLKTLSYQKLAIAMKISEPMAKKTYQLIADWNTASDNQSLAIDSFLGDMYSGLQVNQLSDDDRAYADDHLKILSGLYGVIRPLDSVMPYRLEMGYKFFDPPFDNLYKFWGQSMADTFSDDQLIFNLSSVEYTKSVLPFLTGRSLVAPKFMTIDQASGQARQVVVHSKIARGAFVRWLIQERIDSLDNLANFDKLGYRYQARLSTPTAPVYICQQFQGLGMSVRLKP